MKKINTSTFIFLFISFFAGAQTIVTINSNINLPKDTLEKAILLSSLSNFLNAAQKTNEENKYILETEKIETLILLDELLGIEKNSKLNDDHFYKPYL